MSDATDEQDFADAPASPAPAPPADAPPSARTRTARGMKRPNYIEEVSPPRARRRLASPVRHRH